jgi:hypothetical protein
LNQENAAAKCGIAAKPRTSCNLRALRRLFAFYGKRRVAAPGCGGELVFSIRWCRFFDKYTAPSPAFLHAHQRDLNFSPAQTRPI